MLIINRKESENIDRMVKRYKRKHRKVRMISQIRDNQFHEKKSVQRRNEILNAEYRLKAYGSV